VPLAAPSGAILGADGAPEAGAPEAGAPEAGAAGTAAGTARSSRGSRDAVPVATSDRGPAPGRAPAGAPAETAGAPAETGGAAEATAADGPAEAAAAPSRGTDDAAGLGLDP